MVFPSHIVSFNSLKSPEEVKLYSISHNLRKMCEKREKRFNFPDFFQISLFILLITSQPCMFFLHPPHSAAPLSHFPLPLPKLQLVPLYTRPRLGLCISLAEPSGYFNTEICRASLAGLCLEMGLYDNYSYCVLLSSKGMEMVYCAAGRENTISAGKFT